MLKEIPVGKSKNLIGQKFGSLTVLYRTEPEKGKAPKGAWWACQCDCGKKDLLAIRGDRLTRGEKTSCGCNFKKTGRPINDIKIGTKFGKWEVIKFIDVIDTHATWLCRCECGYEKNITGTSLRLGQTKACPNCKLIRALDISNQTFGKLTALYPTEKRQRSFVIWHCICNCGNECDVSLGNLRNGDVKSCGCLGISYGEYNIRKLLDELNKTYTIQSKFKNCKDKKELPFDFFIENSYLIEYDGIQHFKYKKNINNSWNNKENFEITRKHDLIKNKYCFDNNIPLIRIPYDADYTVDDLLLETTRFLLTPENEKEYYESRM